MTDVVFLHGHGRPADEPDFDARKEAADDACAASTGRDPTVADWGICFGGDAPEAIGGQIVTFNWFADRSSLVDFLREHLAWSYFPPHNYDVSAAQSRVDAALDAFAVHDDPVRLTTDLRDGLRRHVRVDWVGSMVGLMTGDDRFARGMRADHFGLESFDDDTPVDPIPDDEVEDFLGAFLGWIG